MNLINLTTLMVAWTGVLTISHNTVEAFHQLTPAQYYNQHTIAPRIRNTSPVTSKRNTLIYAAAAEEDNDTDSSPGEPSKGFDGGLSLLGLFTPDPKCETTRMSGTDLAYVGDVVFEIFARSKFVWPPKRTSELQKLVVECVRAEHQSQLLVKIKEDFGLSEKELQIVSRGRNAVTRSRNNRRDPATYQDSTAFEALIGYLYIDDKPRCEELLVWLSTRLEQSSPK